MPSWSDNRARSRLHGVELDRRQLAPTSDGCHGRVTGFDDLPARRELTRLERARAAARQVSERERLRVAERRAAEAGTQRSRPAAGSGTLGRIRPVDADRHLLGDDPLRSYNEQESGTYAPTPRKDKSSRTMCVERSWSCSWRWEGKNSAGAHKGEGVVRPVIWEDEQLGVRVGATRGGRAGPSWTLGRRAGDGVDARWLSEQATETKGRQNDLATAANQPI
jgi:hypothetical protein